MTDIRTTPEIEAVLGPEELARVRGGETGSRYKCWKCQQQGATSTDPTSLIVERYAAVQRVAFAHAQCTPPRIIDMDAAMPSGLADPTTGVSILVQAAVVPSGVGVRPLLLVEPISEYSTRSATGDRVDLLISGYLERGLTLMRSAGQRPDPAPGWRMALPGTDRVVVHGPDAVFCDAHCERPPQWLELVLGSGQCVLLTGPIGLDTFEPETSVADALRIINRAARNGLLAGGLVTVSAT